MYFLEINDKKSSLLRSMSLSEDFLLFLNALPLLLCYNQICQLVCLILLKQLSEDRKLLCL